MSESTEQTKKSSFSMTDVVLNAIEPGVNSSVLMFVNVVFLLLILTIILIIAFSTGYKLYMIFLLMIAFGLFMGFNKFVAMIMEEDQNQESSSHDDNKTSNSQSDNNKLKKEE